MISKEEAQGRANILFEAIEKAYDKLKWRANDSPNKNTGKVNYVLVVGVRDVGTSFIHIGATTLHHKRLIIENLVGEYNETTMKEIMK